MNTRTKIMPLSEAGVLGDTLRTRNHFEYLDDCGGGCFLGGALLAVGYAGSRKASLGEAISSYWPWVTPTVNADISHKFRKVMLGEETFEALVEWIRMHEPVEISESAHADMFIQQELSK